MFGKIFWQNVMRDGAILGLVMALSHLFESSMLMSERPLSEASIYISIEMLAATVFFVWYIYRSTKRCSLGAEPELGFPFSAALFYSMMMSLLAGVVVGLSQSIYTNVIGYGAYIDGYVARIDEIAAMMPVDTGAFDEFVDQLRAAEAPTIFNNVLSSMNTYIFFGAIVGLVVAAIVRRDPQNGNITK